MKRCISMLKPIGDVCQHNNMPCEEQQSECINWVDFEYYDPEKTYSCGTLRVGDKTTIFTNQGWLELKECQPDFKSVGIKQYAIKIVHIKGEECGCFERMDRKLSNIKRLLRIAEVESLEKQWSQTK